MVNITELTCRVCLEEQNVLINIYDELEELHTNLSKLLETCADLQINEGDIFPKYLCENCTRELLITSKFRDKCNKSKEILYELLENSRIIEIEETSTNSNDIIEYCAEDLNDLVEEDLIIEEESIEKETAELEPIQDIEINEQQESTLSLLRKNIAETTNETEINQLETNIEETITVENKSENLPLVAEETGNVIPVIVSWDDSTVVVAQEDESMLTSTTKALSEKLKRSHMYKCDICGAIFKQAINLQKHLQKSHDPIHFFTCSKCEHWFSLETEFNKHVENCNYLDINNEIIAENKKLKTDKISAPVYEQDPNRKCVYCERDFPTPFALRMHLRTHTGERPFQCKYCTKSFKTQSQLNVHHKRHTGQADFICTICNKTFYEQSNLTVHMRSHTGERPHVCTVCNKTFTRVFLLQFHMRTHTGEKPYKCSYCDKSFRQHTDLRSHLTIHTGQKQHICVLCGKSYIKRSHLGQHMRKHQLHLATDGVDNAEAALLENEPSTEELNTATDNIQNYVQNPEILYSFDEIIESEDVSSQMEESSTNYNKLNTMVDLCRLCASLRKIDVLVSIKDESNEICEKLRKCFQLNIKMQDALPKTICQECMGNLNKLHKFYIKVTEAQETLQALYPNITTPEESNKNLESAQTSLVKTLSAIKENPRKRNSSQQKEDKVKFIKETDIQEIEKTEIPLKQIKLEKCITVKTNYSIKESKSKNSPENLLQEVYNMLDMTKEEAMMESSYEILETIEENAEDLTEDSSDKYLDYEETSEQPEPLIEEHHVLEDSNIIKNPIEVIEDKQLDAEQTEVIILPDKELNIQFEYVDNYEENEEEDDELLTNSDREQSENKGQEIMQLNSWKSYTYLCYLCDNNFNNFLDLYTHLAAQHQQTEIDKLYYKCFDCQKVIPRYNYFLNHIRSKHHPSLKLKCEVCDLSCQNYEELSYHRSVNCPDANKYAHIVSCNECFKSFHNPYGLQNHYKTQHTNIKLKSKYQCPECDKEFQYKSCLKVHEQVHNHKKKFACSYCDRTFTNKSSLEFHLYSHVNEKTYKCNICNKSFKTYLSLDQHQVLHREEKPFKCEYCEKDFRTKIQKIAHERTHTGEMPFPCGQCTKRFRFLSALNAHIKIHTGVKPYSCEYCDKTFADSSNRNKHVKRKHANSEKQVNKKD
ncbi:uncharacterized protein LOC119605404 [Lucilia sericata]|uniref:uncharacterized protein LOC119605404 n=1 Tax=Lucilia sericata TaxID=13632 RepID=UPI0018A842F1|nr:uncharacterized protein LOC119605404 [Lucilia sericata]